MHHYHKSNLRKPTLKQVPDLGRTTGREGLVCSASRAGDGRAHSHTDRRCTRTRQSSTQALLPAGLSSSGLSPPLCPALLTQEVQGALANPSTAAVAHKTLPNCYWLLSAPGWSHSLQGNTSILCRAFQCVKGSFGPSLAWREPVCLPARIPSAGEGAGAVQRCCPMSLLQRGRSRASAGLGSPRKHSQKPTQEQEQKSYPRRLQGSQQHLPLIKISPGESTSPCHHQGPVPREGCSELGHFRELEAHERAMGQRGRGWDRCVDRGKWAARSSSAERMEPGSSQ